jgi:hypothetical protein
MSATAPSIDRQMRRRAGIPSRIRSARTAPPPAPPHPLPLPGLGVVNALLLLGAVVDTVTVAVPLVVVVLSVTVELPPEQVGGSVAPEGDWVSAQVSVTVPA